MEKQVDLLQALYEECLTICLHVDKEYQGHGHSPLHFFAINMIERIQNRVASLKPLISDPPKIHSYDFGIGLLIRNHCHDFLITVYIHRLVDKKDIYNLNVTLERIRVGGLSINVDYLQGCRGIFIDEPTYQEKIKSLVEANKEYLTVGENGEPELKKIQPVSIKAVFKYLSNDKEVKNVALAYDSYLFYSKYEHYSRDYYDVKRLESYSPLQSIAKSINQMVLHACLAHSLLRIGRKEDVKLQEAYNRLAKLAEELPEV